MLQASFLAMPCEGLPKMFLASFWQMLAKLKARTRGAHELENTFYTLAARFGRHSELGQLGPGALRGRSRRHAALRRMMCRFYSRGRTDETSCKKSVSPPHRIFRKRSYRIRIFVFEKNTHEIKCEVLVALGRGHRQTHQTHAQ